MRETGDRSHWGPPTIRMRLHHATIEASRGRVWWYRIPLLVPFAWIFFRYLVDSEYVSIFAGINLAIHEGGHLFFMWFGIDFLTVAGGTLLQCLCPIVTGRDWNYLLGTLDLLRQDQVIGGAFQVAGILTMGFGLLGGLWVLRIMARVNGAEGRLEPLEHSPST